MNGIFANLPNPVLIVAHFSDGGRGGGMMGSMDGMHGSNGGGMGYGRDMGKCYYA